MPHLLLTLLLAVALALGPAAGLTIGCVCERVEMGDGGACLCCCADGEGEEAGSGQSAECCCSAEPAPAKPAGPDRAPASGAGQIESWVADLVGQPVDLPVADGRGAWGASASAAAGWSARPGLSRLCVWRT